MNGRTIARAAAAAASLAIGAVLTFAAPATAGPQTPVDSGLDHLSDIAGSDPSAQEGVGALRRYADLIGAARLREVSSVFTPFSYAAPTFGCGSNGPITTVIAAATTDGTGAGRDLNVGPGELRFSATPSHSGAPLASGLVVAWVNVNTGASGIDPLDDVTEYRLPTLSKTVKSGPGTVLASMWGIIDYPFAHCVMTPTVGLFTVPDAPAPPPAPAPAPASPAQPAPSGSGGEPTP
ncbi:hypothetical protein ACWEKR_28760 [Nocardia sp. NPDC004573]